METIDKLTLELLMNKNTYSRYIEKTDPGKTRMLSLTMKHLDDPNFQINTELSTMISEYARTFIKYFEMNDLEISCFYSNEKEDEAEDENTMFGTIDPTTDDIFEHNECSSVVADDGNVTTEQANKFLYRYTMDNFVKRK